MATPNYKYWFLVVALLFGIGGVLSYRYWVKPPLPALQAGLLFPDARPLAPFSLTDQQGQAFDNQRLLGKWSLVFVGYTSCPDVCPTTMAKLAAAYPELNQDGDVQVIFLSVDPARDTQQRLAQYIGFFQADFIAVTGEHKDLLPLTRELGMVYSMVGEGADYQVDHSASIVVLSPKGQRYGVFRPRSDGSQPPQIRNSDLIADMRSIREAF